MNYIAPEYFISQLIFLGLNLVCFLGFLYGFFQEQDEEVNNNQSQRALVPTQSTNKSSNNRPSSPSSVAVDVGTRNTRMKNSANGRYERAKRRAGFIHRLHRYGWISCVVLLADSLDPQGVVGVYPLAITDLLLNIPTCICMACAWEAIQAVAISVACTERLIKTTEAQAFIRKFHWVKITAFFIVCTFTFIRFIVTIVKPDDRWSHVVWLMVFSTLVLLVLVWFTRSSRRFVATIRNQISANRRMLHGTSTTDTDDPASEQEQSKREARGEHKLELAIRNLNRLQIVIVIVSIIDGPLLWYISYVTAIEGYPRADPENYSPRTLTFGWVLILVHYCILWVTHLRRHRVRDGTEPEPTET